MCQLPQQCLWKKSSSSGRCAVFICSVSLACLWSSVFSLEHSSGYLTSRTWAVLKTTGLVLCRMFIYCCLVTKSCLTLCDPMDCSMQGFPVHHQLLKLAQTHVHWLGDNIQPSHPLSSPSAPAFKLSQHQGLFPWVSSSHKGAKVLELQLQHQPSNEYSGLISFRIDRLDLLAVQGTLKSLLQHHSLKALILCTQPSLWSISHIQ